MPAVGVVSAAEARPSTQGVADRGRRGVPVPDRGDGSHHVAGGPRGPWRSGGPWLASGWPGTRSTARSRRSARAQSSSARPGEVPQGPAPESPGSSTSGLSANSSTAPEVRYDLGLAHQRLAEIDRELGNYPAAEESAGKAVTLLGALSDQPQYVGVPARPGGRLRHARLSPLGFGAVGRGGGGLRTGRRDPGVQAAEHSGSSHYRYALAKTLTTSAFTLNRANREDAAAVKLRQALGVLNGAGDDD